ncbi:hypothetical protein JRQ81_001752 [Phrynocephalus forsythii]|uniref:Histamine N-methyltransferase n=1 Tax=Phrynocephalus forsythii TaxID=171643 RepID=A0A9Q0Y8E1_9SAUR|nr:hypothetical protein JRQ81_001752 [Phrynocephalus forsythii]
MTMRSLLSDNSRYTETFHAFLKNSTEHQCMLEFVQKTLPGIISSIGDGKSPLNVLSVGGGTGEIDLQILKQIRAKYPGVAIHNEVIEPNGEQISCYKEHVAKTSGLENITFTWHKETSFEYESRMKASKEMRKLNFIHMIQMLYYVKDVPATIGFFHSLLEPGAKLLIIILSGTSGWARLWKKYGPHLHLSLPSSLILAPDIEEILNEAGMQYQSYELPSHMDITDCFTEGNKNGELLLDFLTETCNFSKTAPPDLKCDIIEDLKKPEYSEMRGGRYFFNNSLNAIVI